MLDQEHGQPQRMDAVEDLRERRGLFVIYAGGGFVEQQKLGRRDDGPGDFDDALLPVRQVFGFDIEPIEAKEMQYIPRLGAGCLLFPITQGARSNVPTSPTVPFEK